MQHSLRLPIKVLILCILLTVLVQFMFLERGGQALQPESAVTMLAAEEHSTVPEAQSPPQPIADATPPATVPEIKPTAPQKTSVQNKSQPQATAKKTSTPKVVPKPSSTTPNEGSKSVSQVIGTSPVIGSYTQEDYYWLAKMIYAEAGAEPYDGQVAVGAVILHRVASPEYPNTVKEVEYQVVDGHYQFTPVLNGYINAVEPNSTAFKAAKDALAGVDPSKGAILYYNPVTSTNKWILSRPVTLVIGNHTFAK